MAYVMLKNTSNPKFKDLIGRVGELIILDNGRFCFEFSDSDGTKKVLSSGVKGRLGDLDDVRSKEVNIVTNNSSYDFTKLENYLEEAKLFSNALCPSVDERIAACAGMSGASTGERHGNSEIER